MVVIIDGESMKTSLTLGIDPRLREGPESTQGLNHSRGRGGERAASARGVRTTRELGPVSRSWGSTP